MADTSKRSRTSGSEGSELTTKSKSEPGAGENGVVRLKSLCEGGGEHPGTVLTVPPSGECFEADAEKGAALIACGLAASAPAGVKGE